jgi:hypothetical protein
VTPTPRAILFDTGGAVLDWHGPLVGESIPVVSLTMLPLPLDAVPSSTGAVARSSRICSISASAKPNATAGWRWTLWLYAQALRPDT